MFVLSKRFWQFLFSKKAKHLKMPLLGGLLQRKVRRLVQPTSLKSYCTIRSQTTECN